ncbi:hypothetical protein MRX96_036153 [Rhipicephalus microplus]
MTQAAGMHWYPDENSERKETSQGRLLNKSTRCCFQRRRKESPVGRVAASSIPDTRRTAHNCGRLIQKARDHPMRRLRKGSRANTTWLQPPRLVLLPVPLARVTLVLQRRPLGSSAGSGDRRVVARQRSMLLPVPDWSWTTEFSRDLIGKTCTRGELEPEPVALYTPFTLESADVVDSTRTGSRESLCRRGTQRRVRSGQLFRWNGDSRPLASVGVVAATGVVNGACIHGERVSVQRDDHGRRRKMLRLRLRHGSERCRQIRTGTFVP